MLYEKYYNFIFYTNSNHHNIKLPFIHWHIDRKTVSNQNTQQNVNKQAIPQFSDWLPRLHND